MKPKVSVLIPAYEAEDTIKRAIDSIPDRDDIEILVWDDGSKDQTMKLSDDLLADRKNPHLVGKSWSNQGVAHTVNRLLDNAGGEFVVLLGSDDWFLTKSFEAVVDMLKPNLDLVYFNLVINDGTVMCLSPETKLTYCGSTKFMRRAFVGSLRCNEEKRAGEDWFFYQELLKKKPVESFTNTNVKRYNFPRKGSLSWKQRNGEFDPEEL